MFRSLLILLPELPAERHEVAVIVEVRIKHVAESRRQHHAPDLERRFRAAVSPVGSLALHQVPPLRHLRHAVHLACRPAVERSFLVVLQNAHHGVVQCLLLVSLRPCLVLDRIAERDADGALHYQSLEGEGDACHVLYPELLAELHVIGSHPDKRGLSVFGRPAVNVHHPVGTLDRVHHVVQLRVELADILLVFRDGGEPSSLECRHHLAKVLLFLQEPFDVEFCHIAFLFWLLSLICP